MSTASAGYWPLSYHGGSVWMRDPAIAIAGLSFGGATGSIAVNADGEVIGGSGLPLVIG